LGPDFHKDYNLTQNLYPSIFQVMVLGHSQILHSVAVPLLGRGQLTDDF